MKSACGIVLILLAASLGAETNVSRVRIENPGTDGRVAIVVSDENVVSEGNSVPGVVSGEAITVEAPAPLVRLGGGSMSGDPLLEAIVSQKVAAASPRRPNVIVVRSGEPFRLESYGHGYQGFVDAPFIGWQVPYRSYSHNRSYSQTKRTSSCQTRTSHRAQRSVPNRTTRSRGSFTSRGMMPKR